MLLNPTGDTRIFNIPGETVVKNLNYEYRNGIP